MRFSTTFLDEIRDRVPISSVIGARVSWDKRKTNASRGDYWACCPFHGEKSPSFHCEDRKGRYHCFGCGVTGDHFRFLTELEGLSFPEAVERMAEMAGVPMPARDAEEERRDRQRASLTDVMEMATQWFQDRLQAPEGAKARAYLRDRGLTSVTQQTFRLGFAPDSRNGLKEFLAGKGVGKDQIEACGLVRHGPDIPVSYDYFRDRIMFPIEDRQGRVIAFGGRAMAADALAKYMNSPDTELFHKGSVLYNFARARKAQGKDGTIIAVEGYMDAIALTQAGFGNVVAPLGTALTESQLDILWRMTGEPIMCFDGDKAGLRAAYRAADLALPLVEAGRTARFLLLPEGQDPDDLVREQGPDAFARVMADARPLADMIWLRETGGAVFDTPEKRAALEKNLRELTGRIRDEGVRHHYQQDMRERAKAFFSPQPAGRGGGDFRRGQGGPGKGGRGGQAEGRVTVSESLARSVMVKGGGQMPVREATIIVALACHPALMDESYDLVEMLDLTHGGLVQLHASLLDAMAHHRAGDHDSVLEVIRESGLEPVWEQARDIVLRVRAWTALEGAALDDARDAFAQALHLHRSQRTLHRELKAAEIALAADATEENFLRLIDIQAQFRDAQATDALIEGFGVQSGRAGRS